MREKSSAAAYGIREREQDGDALAFHVERIRAIGYSVLDSGISRQDIDRLSASLDAILDLRRREQFVAEDVEQIDVDVDSITPTILIHERPSSGLEGKFSMPFCAAAAAGLGRVDLETFDSATLSNPVVMRLMPRVAMRVMTGGTARKSADRVAEGQANKR